MTTDALIIKGDCLNVMAGLPDGSIDAIVTDPPYGLSFMGKDWDKGVPGESFWREALRVAKPGCHILAAGGSRTYHRLTCAIEDAGWEIRDCIIWMYGSGFPKSHDVSKAIDREAGAEREAVGKSNRHGGGAKVFESQGGTGFATNGKPDITAPATEAARQWQGWGTALKPAFEPFILARKPLDGTVANNVQRHGCGGLNVDGCRIQANDDYHDEAGLFERSVGSVNCYGGFTNKYKRCPPASAGRWPANVIHDGSDEVIDVFRGTEEYNRPGNRTFKTSNVRATYHLSGLSGPFETVTYDDTGNNSRFFYCAKASPSEREEGLNNLDKKLVAMSGGGQAAIKRNEADYGNNIVGYDKIKNVRNHHPTVKPIDLMKYLCRLITPPDGLILDPFCGSGSTGVAAMREGFNFIGIELNQDYAEIARRRIDHERNKTPLFSNVI